MTPPRFLIAAMLLALSTALWGCGDVPELKDATSARAVAADYPGLVALDTLLLRAEATRHPEQTGSTLAARVAALRNRAATLRAPVIEQSRRRALQTALAARR